MHAIVKKLHTKSSGPLCHLCGKVIPCEHFTFSAVKHVVQEVEHVDQVVTTIMNDDEIKHEMQMIQDKHNKTLEKLHAMAKIMEELDKDHIIDL